MVADANTVDTTHRRIASAAAADVERPSLAGPGSIVVSRRAWIGSSVGAILGAAWSASACAPPAPLVARTSPEDHLLHLGLNESPFGPSPAALRAIQGELGSLARYTGEEAASLTSKVAAFERVPEGQIVLGEVLEPLGAYLAQRNGSGGEVVYSTPGYTALADAAQTAGGAAIGVPLDASLANDLPGLASRIGPATRALFLVNPHNPSGTVSDGAAFHAFVTEASRRTLVIVDEAYLEYQDDLAARTCAAHAAAGENVAVFRTFSKIHGMAGLPIGYAVLPAPIAAALRLRGVGHPRSLDRLAVAAAAASLGDPSFVASVRARVAVERARWNVTLDALGLRRTDARGSFVFFETGRPHAELAAAMRARSVDIGRSFPPLDLWARVSIGLPHENALAQAALRDIVARW
jgi:histidinol-phosphate aminotransferase